MDDRYAQNTADMLRQAEDAKRAGKADFRAARREKTMQDEAARWQSFDAKATKDREKWDDIRAESLKSKANLSSLPYDPVTLRTKDSVDGLQYEYEEGLMQYREQLRSKNLYGKYNANGFNPINGTPLYMGEMPQRPMNVEQLAQQKDAMRNADAVALVKRKIVERGGMNGIRTAGKMFRSMDASGNGILSRQELVDGLSQFGIEGLSVDQVDDVVRAFDATGDGSISIAEFLRQLRGPMAEMRVALVQQAWLVLDSAGDGQVTVQDMMGKYDVSQRPEVVQGRMSRDQAMQEFMYVWDKDSSGVITWPEFIDYYQDLSAAIDDDGLFEMTLRNAWQLSGGVGMFANTTTRRVLVVHKSGQMTVREVPGGILPNNMPPAALLRLIKTRFKEAGVQVIDIKLSG